MHLASGGSPGAILEPEAVVDACLADLARRRTLCVPGWRHRAVVDVLELPRRTLRALAKLAGRGRQQQPPAEAATVRLRAAA